MNLKFSIAIAVYNKEKQIAQTLQSVLAQTYTDFEVVIVNDGSTDNSEQVIKSFNDPRIRYFTQENQGAAAGRNAAIEKCNARYIALLDADDLWHREYLSVIYRLIQKYPEEKVFAVAAAVESYKKILQPKYSINNIKPNEVYKVDFFEASCINSVLTSSSTVLHRSVLEKTGLYNSAIKSGEDTDLWIRIGMHYPVIFKNSVLVTYRYVHQSLSNTSKKVSEKADFDSYLNEEQNNPAMKKFLDLNRYSLALLAKRNGDTASFKKNTRYLDLKNLNRRQVFLLLQPRIVLQSLFWIKNTLRRLGINLSAFR